MAELVVFSDLDGTLLDHVSYDFSPALPALRALEKRDIPVVLASSKTGAEIMSIREAMALENYPAIVENGAGELSPGRSAEQDYSEYYKLQSILDDLPVELRLLFRGFADMTDADVADITGLSLETAKLARQRAYTEPGVFSGSAAEKDRFRSALRQAGVSSHEGGRFLTLSFGQTKADRIRAIMSRLDVSYSIALGDAPNDRDMLLAANQAVIVRNDHAPDIGAIPEALYTELPGPAGWNEAVLALLESRFGH